MNLAEVIHAGWVKRDKMGMTLLGTAYANASVPRGAKVSKQGRPGCYRSTRSKCFTDLLQRAKQDKDLIKVKELNFGYSGDHGLIWTLRTSRCTNYRVSMNTQPSCDCPDFLKHRGKEQCKHVIWTLMYVCGMPEDSAV